jgi:hypothetical protein
MPIYECKLCFKEFYRKCNYDDHIKKKKKPCIVTCIQKIPSAEKPHKTAQNGTNPAQIPHKTAQNGTNILELLNADAIISKLNNFKEHSDVLNIEENNENTDTSSIICEYCDKIFLRKDSLTRHLKKFCKNKKQNDNNEIIIKSLVEEVSLLKELIKNNLSQPATINTNTVHNNKIINNVQNNVQHNVQLNIRGFGKEDLEKLDIKEAMNVYLKSTGGNIIPNMLNYINLNKNYPENHNICITDISREIVKIHNGKKYVYKKFKNAKFDIVDSVVCNINEIIGIYKDGNYKKTEDIDKKININDTSLKLITGEELSETDHTYNSNDKENNANLDFNSANSEEIINDLKNMDENIQKMINKKKENTRPNSKINISHLNSKKEGLQKLTYEKIKDELYNNRELVEQHDKILKL